MAHDAALFAESVKQRKTPAESNTQNATQVAAAKTKFEAAEEQTETTYRGLVGQGGEVSLASIAPTSGVTGTVITLTGTGFVPTSKVVVTSTPVTTTYVNPTTLTAAVAGSVGGKNISVDNGHGDVSNVRVFTITGA